MIRRETLIDEHAAIEAVAADLLHHAAERPASIAAIARTRWQFSRLLLAHLAKEDRLLHPQLQRGGSPEAADLSRRFEAEMGGLAEAFKRFMTTWDGDRIAADPDAFERDALTIVTALSARIHREETQLYRHIPAPPDPREVDAAARRA